MNEKDDKVFLKVCQNISSLSHCISKQVAVIGVKDRRIIATGINGTIKGTTNCDEHYSNGTFTREEHHDWSLLNEVHAEINMISYCAKNGISLEGATVYCTLEPCTDCSKALAVSGIKHIVYLNGYEYTPKEAKQILINAGISISKFDGDL